MENNDPVFEPETWSERIFGNIIFYFLVTSTAVGAFTLIAIFIFEIASVVWGDYTVIYWLADLF